MVIYPAEEEVTPGGGGHYHWKMMLYSGQLALPSLPIFHQFAAHVPPLFNFKNFAFSALFGAKISVLKMQNV